MKRFLLGVLLFGAFPAAAQDAKILSRAAALLKKVPPHATLAQAKRLLPPGTKLGAQKTTGQGAGKTWIVVPFQGALNGQFVFFNTRRAPVRKAGSPPPPPFGNSNKILFATDQLHYVEIFLGGPLTNNKKGALTTRTKSYTDALSKILGRPATKENTGEEGGPDTVGWLAEWKLSGGRHLQFMHSLALLSSDDRPLLTLDWPYSKIYRS